MQINNCSVNEKCNRYKNKFEVLRVFSSKLRHLQLSYNQFINTISEIKYIMWKNNLTMFDEVIYIIKLEKLVLEILSTISSIRDCLKNKILETNKTNSKSFKAAIIINAEPTDKDFNDCNIILVVNTSNDERTLYYYDYEQMLTQKIELELPMHSELKLITNKTSLEKFLDTKIKYFSSIGVTPTKKGNNVNGNLCDEFKDINSKYFQILNDTIHKEENQVLKELANNLRDKLVHSSLQETRLITHTLCILGKPHTAIDCTLYCDFDRLILLIGWHNKYWLLYKYFMDEHLINLKNTIVLDNSPPDQELKHRIKHCNDNVKVAYMEYIHESMPSNSPILLHRDTITEINQDKKHSAAEKLYTKIFQAPDYRMFSYLNFCKAIANRDQAKLPIKKPKMYFDLENAIIDIYNIYFEYYSRLHNLITLHWAIDLEDYKSSQKKLIPQNEVDEVMQQLSFDLKPNRYSNDANSYRVRYNINND